MFDAVIFDCDGVLVDSEVIAVEIELQHLAAIGLTYEREAYMTRFVGTSVSAFYEALNGDSLANLGRPLPDGFATACQEDARAAMQTRLQAVPGALDAVQAWRGRKAVASSSTAVSLHQKLQHTGLWPHFDPHIYSANDVARAKPAPDLFLHAAQALGADPARCLAIEDSSNGVVAARAAGMTVWGFTGGGHATPGTAPRLRDAGASLVVATWAEARALFSVWPDGAAGAPIPGLSPRG